MEEIAQRLLSLFHAFARFGDRSASTDSAETRMDSARFFKFAKDCGLLDKILTETDVDLIFVRVKPKAERKINFDQFIAGLELIGQRKFPSLNPDEALNRVLQIVCLSDGPTATATRPDSGFRKPASPQPATLNLRDVRPASSMSSSRGGPVTPPATQRGSISSPSAGPPSPPPSARFGEMHYSPTAVPYQAPTPPRTPTSTSSSRGRLTEEQVLAASERMAELEIRKSPARVTPRRSAPTSPSVTAPPSSRSPAQPKAPAFSQLDSAYEERGPQEESGDGNVEPDGGAPEIDLSSAGTKLQSVFMSFCSFGDRSNQGTMDGAKFSKIMKDCSLLDRAFTTTEVDIIFAKSKTKGDRRINFEQFLNALELVAEKKRIPFESVVLQILRCEGPTANATTTFSTGSSTLTDYTQYTGVYKQRFNEDGTGRGLSGSGSYRGAEPYKDLSQLVARR